MESPKSYVICVTEIMFKIKRIGTERSNMFKNFMKFMEEMGFIEPKPEAPFLPDRIYKDGKLIKERKNKWSREYREVK
jgi:hypothetical protein